MAPNLNCSIPMTGIITNSRDQGRTEESSAAEAGPGTWHARYRGVSAGWPESGERGAGGVQRRNASPQPFNQCVPGSLTL